MVKAKRLLSIVLAVLMLCSVFVVAPITANAATSHTKDEAISWVQSKLGQKVGSGQCVALITAYYSYLGVSPVSGNGSDYTWNNLPSGWQRLQGAQPQKGDILVYTGGYNNYGHVAIYESDYVTYHQNFGDNQTVQKVTYKYNAINNPYWGVIRPDFKESGSEIEVVDYGQSFCAQIYNKPAWKTLGVSDTGNVEMVENIPANNKRTIWRFIKNDDNTYRVEALFAEFEKCLTSGGAKESNCYISKFTNSGNQKWYFIRNKTTGREVMQCGDFLLDAVGGSTAPGTNIQMFVNNNTDAQFFCPYYLTNDSVEVNYTISSDKTTVNTYGEKVKVTVSGVLQYVHGYTFYVLEPNGQTTAYDNQCNPVFEYMPQENGTYKIYCKAVNVFNSDKGSPTNKSVTIISNITKPTETPTEAPTVAPTTAPTDASTQATTAAQTNKPTEAPTAEPIDTQPVTDKPTEPIETQPVTDKPTEPAETQPITDKPTEPIETQPVTDKPTEPAATQPSTDAPTEPSATQPSTDAPTEPATDKPGDPTQPVEKKDISNWEVIGLTNKVYTGKAITQKVAVTNGTDYAAFDVSYKNNVNAGNATIIITGIGDCTGTIVETFMITKAANPVKVTTKATVKAKAKKKTTIKKAIVVKMPQGKVTYSTNNKKVKIKNGTMTVAKGLKKGKTYKIKVTITVKGNGNYKSKKIVKTIKVKIK